MFKEQTNNFHQFSTLYKQALSVPYAEFTLWSGGCWCKMTCFHKVHYLKWIWTAYYQFSVTLEYDSEWKNITASQNYNCSDL